MRNMMELKNILCEELEHITEKGSISHTDLDNVFKLTESIKNIMKIDGMDEAGYSYDGDWTARGNYGRSYDGYDSSNRGSYNSMRRSYGEDDGSSYRGRHYVRGHYSYGEDKGMMMDKLAEMMDSSNLSLDDKSTLKRAMEVLRK